jgi:hypothetical protein
VLLWRADGSAGTATADLSSGCSSTLPRSTHGRIGVAQFHLRRLLRALTAALAGICAMQSVQQLAGAWAVHHTCQGGTVILCVPAWMHADRKQLLLLLQRW